MGTLLVIAVLVAWLWWACKMLWRMLWPILRPDVAQRSSAASAPKAALQPSPRCVTQPTPLAPDAEQSIKTASDIPHGVVTAHNDECAVCGSTRPARFITPRIRLCQWCVKGINDSAPIDVVAMARVVEQFRHKGEDARSYWSAVLNGQRSHESIRRAMRSYGLQPDGTTGAFWLKSLRAYQWGILSGGVPYFRPAPDAWEPLAQRIRREDGHRCCICAVGDEELHVHHIIHLQHYGTNHPRNLVTLCYPHHCKQHPKIRFCVDALPAEDEGVT